MTKLNKLRFIKSPEKNFKFSSACEFREFRENLDATRVTGCELFANSCEFFANSQNKTDLRLKFATVQHCRDTQIKRYEADWSWMTTALSRPKKRHEKDGKAIIFSIFNVGIRKAENVEGITALGFDLEVNKGDGSVPPSASEAAAIVALAGVEAVIYTTYSHSPNAPRYRIFFPLTEPLPPTELKIALSVVAEGIPDISHWIDQTCKDAARLFYLPAYHPDREADFEFYHVAGDILNTDTLQSLIDYKKRTIAAKKEAKRQRLSVYSCDRKNAVGSVIQRFNAMIKIDDILQLHGYQKKGKRWLSPVSSTGVAGIHVFEDGRMFSHHADPLGNQGTLLDSFEAFTLLEHRGDKKAATRAALRLMEARS